MSKLKSVDPSPAVKTFREGVMKLMKDAVAAGDMSAEEVLAILAYTVGQALALQDQRTMTSQQGLALVSNNIEAGNADAIANFLQTPAMGGTQ